MDIFMGFIAAFGFNYAPRYWSQCAGQLVAVGDNQALFSLLGDFYGGDARTVFGLPELRGRAPIGYGQSPGLPNFPIGLKYGNIENTLDLTQLPPHTHIATVTGGGGGTATGTLQATIANGNHDVPQAGDMLATSFKVRGDTMMNYASADKRGTDFVDLAGLTIQGGGGGTPSVTNSSTGQGQDFSIMQPILAINYCIVMQGLYPSHN